MNFVFHTSAREELNRAVDYYEECEAGLGYDFLEEVYATIKRIQAYPEAWTHFSSRTRRCLTHRFPFSVVSLSALFTLLKKMRSRSLLLLILTRNLITGNND